MLTAERYGKISPRRPPHCRMEDVLTSYLFSLFRYLNNPQVLISWLRQAKDIKNQPLLIKDLLSVEVFFWPRFSFPGAGMREPDILLLLKETGGKRTAAVIEAKYDADLTNLGSKEGSNGKTPRPFQYGHQLADYYCGPMCGLWNTGVNINSELSRADEKIIIYVTGHYGLPRNDIAKTVEGLSKRKPASYPGKAVTCQKNINESLYWVGWRNLYNIIGNSLSSYVGGELNYLLDLHSVLELWRLQPFHPPFNGLIPLSIYKSFLVGLCPRFDCMVHCPGDSFPGQTLRQGRDTQAAVSYHGRSFRRCKGC